jgi:hypothetical protein
VGATGDEDERRPRFFGVGVKRAVLVLIYLLVTWPLVLGNSSTNFPADIPEGLIVATVLLMVAAAVNLAWRRRRWSRSGQSAYRPTYRMSLTAVPVVLVALILAALSAAGQSINSQKQRESLATSDASSSNPVDRDRGAYAAWLSDYPTAVGQMALAAHNLNLVRNEEKKAKPSLRRLVVDFAAAQSHAKLYLAAVSDLAASRPVVQQMKALHLQEARTLVAATNDYARGLKPYNQHLLNAGDLLWARFVTQVRASSRAEDVTYHRLGGYAAFKNRIDWNALASEMGSATSTGRSG